MLKKLLGLTSLLALVLLTSCSEYEKTEGGLRYKIIVDSAGAVPVEGGAIFFDAKFYKVKEGAEDSILTPKAESSVVGIAKDIRKGSLEEGFKLLSKGDSAVFVINVDSFFTFNGGSPANKPPFLKDATDLKIVVKVTKVLTAAELKVEQDKMAREKLQERIMLVAAYKEELMAADSNKALIKKDEDQIKSYLAKNKVKAERTQNGVYYNITRPGTGAKIAPGDTVKANYVGKLMNGTVFDSSTVERGPLPFTAGAAQVILGWDEVVTYLKKGDKATVYIPSILAYGTAGSPPKIPANAILIFDIEVVE